MAAFMDEVVIDSVSGEQITSKHAIIVPAIPGVTEMMEYVRPIAESIGPKNIRSAYLCGGQVKIYLRYLKHVDELVASGVNIRGQFSVVDYFVQPATKILLKDVDSEIPNRLLSDKLVEYGKLSRISTFKLSVDDSSYAHIQSNVRQAFIHVEEGRKIPSSFELEYELKKHTISVFVEKSEDKSHLHIHSEPGPSTPLSGVSEESAVDHENDNELPGRSGMIIRKPQVAFRARGIRIGRCGRQRGRGRGIVKLTVSSGITRAYRRHMRRGRRGRGYRRGGFPRAHERDDSVENAMDLSEAVSMSYDSVAQTRLQDLRNGLPEGGDAAACIKLSITDNAAMPEQASYEVASPRKCDKLPNDAMDVNCSPAVERMDLQNITQYPFSLQKLEFLVRESKNARNPVEVAVNMLEANNTPNAMSGLCNQLIEYHNCIHDDSTKMKVNRLVMTLSGNTKSV